MAEHPEQVDEVHQIPAHVVREKVEAKEAVEPEHRAAGCEGRHRKDQQDGGAEGRPSEKRHPHEIHPRRAQLVNRHRKIDAREGGADSRNRDGQNVIIWADSGVDQAAREGGIPGPATRRKLADHQRDHEKKSAGRCKAQADLIEPWKSHISGADLQGNDDIDQTKQERHRHEKDHVGAVGREKLVEVIRGEKPAIEADRLVRPHQNPLDHSPEQHNHREDDIHRADFFVIDTREPFEKRLPPLHPGEKSDNHHSPDRHHGRRAGGDECVDIWLFDRLNEDDRVPS